jgi:hypothetical protein
MLCAVASLLHWRNDNQHGFRHNPLHHGCHHSGTAVNVPLNVTSAAIWIADLCMIDLVR